MNEIRKYMNLVESKLFEDSKDDNTTWSNDENGKPKIDSTQAKSNKFSVDPKKIDAEAIAAMLKGLMDSTTKQMWADVQRGYREWEVADDHILDIRTLFNASKLQDVITTSFYESLSRRLNDKNMIDTLLNKFEKDANGFVAFQQDISKRLAGHVNMISKNFKNKGWSVQEAEMPDYDTVSKMHSELPYNSATTPKLEAVLDAAQKIKHVVDNFWSSIMMPAFKTLKQNAPESYAFIEEYDLLPNLEKEIKRLSHYVSGSIASLEQNAVKDLWKGSSQGKKN